MKSLLYLFITVTFFALSASQQQLIEERAEYQEWLKIKANTKLLKRHEAYCRSMRFIASGFDVAVISGIAYFAVAAIDNPNSNIFDSICMLFVFFPSIYIYSNARAHTSLSHNSDHRHCSISQEIMDLVDDDSLSVCVHYKGFSNILKIAYDNEEKYKKSWQFLIDKYWKRKVRKPLLSHYIGVYNAVKSQQWLNKERIAYIRPECISGIRYVFVDKCGLECNPSVKDARTGYYFPKIEYFSKHSLDHVYQKSPQKAPPTFDKMQLINSCCNFTLVSKKTLVSLLPYLPLGNFKSIFCDSHVERLLWHNKFEQDIAPNFFDYPDCFVYGNWFFDGYIYRDYYAHSYPCQMYRD
ncbi:MAG: hypothetical protein WC707_05295 [Candidatus Babeliaceae bacterium]|jgi:hypothetical protein